VSNPSAGRVDFSWTSATDSLSGWAGNQYRVCDIGIVNCDSWTSTTGTFISSFRLSGKEYVTQVRSFDAAGNLGNAATTSSIKSGLRIFVSNGTVLSYASSLSAMQTLCNGDANRPSNPATMEPLVALRDYAFLSSPLEYIGPSRVWNDIVVTGWNYFATQGSTAKVFTGNTFIPGILDSAIWPGQSTQVITGFTTSNNPDDFGTCKNYTAQWAPPPLSPEALKVGVPGNTNSSWIDDTSYNPLAPDIECSTEVYRPIYCVEIPR
jgi:hypothetical protein